LKLKVSHRETIIETNRLRVKRYWSCHPSPATPLFIGETEKRWKRRQKDWKEISSEKIYSILLSFC